MRHIKIISIILVFCLALSGPLLAQEKEQEKQAYEQAKQAYEMAKQYVNKENWKDAIAQFRKAIEIYQKSEYMDKSLY